MIYKKYNNNSFNLYTIKTDKFKSCYMEIIFYKEIEKNDITKEIVLSNMLFHSNKKYNKRKYVVEHLEDLYNAKMYSSTSRVGNLRTINFMYSFIDPMYAEKNYLKEAISFPFEMLFNPNIKNEEFDNRTLKIIKSRILADILNQKDDVQSYSIKKALEHTSKDILASLNLNGNIKDLNKINPSNLVDDFKNLFIKYQCDIYLIGNLDMDKTNILIKDLFDNDIIKTNKLKLNCEVNNKLKGKIINEKKTYEQSNLVCVYNLNNLTNKEKNYTFNIFNALFGSDSLSNKLYKNLREDNYLCYNISSFYNKYDNLLIITTGINKKNKSKAIRLIKKSLKEMVVGKFSDKEVDNAISLTMNNLRASLDNQSIIINNYFFNNLDNSPLIKERLENQDNINKKDIIVLSKKIKLLTIYFLEGTN